MTIADLSERALIARVRQRAPAPGAHVVTGIGDDAALLRPARGMADVVTTDVLVEGVHFNRAWSSGADIGAKAVAVNLSDLAAMGARPRSLLLSLVLPATLLLEDFDALVGAAIDTAAAAGASLVGGNLSRSPGPLVVDVTAIGAVRPRRALHRSGARPGDRLFVTGLVGRAAAGLALLASGAPTETAEARECVTAHRRPLPRLRTGQTVANNRAASACMDLSDGLADAVRQMCEASGCGAEVDEAAIARHPLATWDQALSGGEDYELLFAVPKHRTRLFRSAIRQAGEVGVTDIGVCTRGTTVTLVTTDGPGPLPAGFHHF